MPAGLCCPGGFATIQSGSGGVLRFQNWHRFVWKRPPVVRPASAMLSVYSGPHTARFMSSTFGCGVTAGVSHAGLLSPGEAQLQRKAAISDACTRAADTLKRRRDERGEHLLQATSPGREWWICLGLKPVVLYSMLYAMLYHTCYIQCYITWCYVASAYNMLYNILCYIAPPYIAPLASI